jgi:two-component system, NtrC family, sensor kinase
MPVDGISKLKLCSLYSSSVKKFVFDSTLADRATNQWARAGSARRSAKRFWLFRKLNLSLTAEIIINISLVMLVAILLIGFSISKVYEKRILDEKMNSAVAMIGDIQTFIDFVSSGNQGFSFSGAPEKREIQHYLEMYARRRGIQDIMILDRDLKVIIREPVERTKKGSAGDLMKNAVQLGRSEVDVEKHGNFIMTEYKRLVWRAPLWVHGKIVGGIRMELSLSDVMDHLLRAQTIVLILMVLNAFVLLMFGSFLLSRVLATPLKDLANLTHKISEGDFTRKIQVASTNEIGQLIASFNRMIDRLSENRDRLKSHVRSLELKNIQLKQAQEELIRAEKLSSIGRFAAGVAHEVGNPLGAILGYTGILQRHGTEPEESKDYLKRIEKEIARINHIVRELLDYARPSKLEIREVDVNKVLENTLSLLSYEKNFKTIETQTDLQHDLPVVKGDESLLSQVFMNVILNAVDAMPRGGTLRVETEEDVIENAMSEAIPESGAFRRSGDPAESDYSHLRKSGERSTFLTKFAVADRVVKIRISDTGVGIRKEDLDPIFDPFFTTKGPDKGTGLGLSICLRILESMGGEIRVESEVGKGAAFEVYLPGRQAWKDGIVD